MLYARECLRKEPPLGELNDPPLPKHSQILWENEYYPKSIKKFHGKRHKHEEKSSIQNDRRIVKVSSEKEIAHAAFLQRVLRGKITLLVIISSLLYSLNTRLFRAICIVHRKEQQIF